MRMYFVEVLGMKDEGGSFNQLFVLVVFFQSFVQLGTQKTQYLYPEMSGNGFRPDSRSNLTPIEVIISLGVPEELAIIGWEKFNDVNRVADSFYSGELIKMKPNYRESWELVDRPPELRSNSEFIQGRRRSQDGDRDYADGDRVDGGDREYIIKESMEKAFRNYEHDRNNTVLGLDEYDRLYPHPPGYCEWRKYLEENFSRGHDENHRYQGSPPRDDDDDVEYETYSERRRRRRRRRKDPPTPSRNRSRGRSVSNERNRDNDRRDEYQRYKRRNSRDRESDPEYYHNGRYEDDHHPNEERKGRSISPPRNRSLPRSSGEESQEEERRKDHQRHHNHQEEEETEKRGSSRSRDRKEKHWYEYQSKSKENEETNRSKEQMDNDNNNHNSRREEPEKTRNWRNRSKKTPRNKHHHHQKVSEEDRNMNIIGRQIIDSMREEIKTYQKKLKNLRRKNEFIEQERHELIHSNIKKDEEIRRIKESYEKKIKELEDNNLNCKFADPNQLSKMKDADDLERINQRNEEMLQLFQRRADEIEKNFRHIYGKIQSRIGEIKSCLCQICAENERNIASVECGHVFCIKCIDRLDDCPVCRTPIRNRLRIYGN